MENEREEDYIVGVVRIIRGLYVSGTMEFYVQGITYCILIFFFKFTANLLSSLSFESGKLYITSCHFIWGRGAEVTLIYHALVNIPPLLHLQTCIHRH